MVKVKGLSDTELIRRAQNRNQEAVEVLMHRYKGMVRKKARSLFLMGGDQDDLIQEGMIGLFKAIQSYDPDKDTSFLTFARLCVSRQLYDAVRTSNRKKNIPLNTYVSIYAPVHEQENPQQGDGFMVDYSLESLEMSPEEILIDRENAENLREDIKNRLSDMEKDIFELYMEGMTYQEIARYIQKEPKSIDNALQRIKSKVNKVLAEQGDM